MKVKQENRAIIADAEGLYSGRDPDVVLTDVKVHEAAEARYDVKIWDEEGCTSWEGLARPVRCMKIQETVSRREGGQWVRKTCIEYLVTTYPKATVPAVTLWKAMHRRWDIENSVFHLLKTYCSFEHCFCHDENAVPAMWLLMAIAFNLFRLFTLRNLRESKNFIGVALLILMSLPHVTMPLYRAALEPG